MDMDPQTKGTLTSLLGAFVLTLALVHTCSLRSLPTYLWEHPTGVCVCVCVTGSTCCCCYWTVATRELYCLASAHFDAKMGHSWAQSASARAREREEATGSCCGCPTTTTTVHSRADLDLNLNLTQSTCNSCARQRPLAGGLTNALISPVARSDLPVQLIASKRKRAHSPDQTQLADWRRGENPIRSLQMQSAHKSCYFLFHFISPVLRAYNIHILLDIGHFRLAQVSAKES